MAIETIKFTVTRDQLGPNSPHKNTQYNLSLSAIHLTTKLRNLGMPVVGVVDGIILVERGKLTIEHEDGLDGDEWTYTFVGEPIMKELMSEVRKPGFGLTLAGPTLAEREAALRAQIEQQTAKDDEL